MATGRCARDAVTRSPIHAGVPPHAPGLRVGLFGGSFDPAHEGHRLVATMALTRLRLDRVWLCPTPGNPLKANDRLTPLDARLRQAADFMNDPRIVVTAFEREIGTRYTVDAISFLTRRCAGVRFVWLMGADNLRQFHRWKRWRDIAAMVPIAVIDRPGATLSGPLGRAATTLGAFRLPEADATRLAERTPPCFTVLHGRRSDLSSTALRAGRVTA